MGHLPSESITLPIRAAGLANQVDGEAAFAIDETDDPSDLYQSFLLIVRTGRIVTHRTNNCTVGTAGYNGFSSK